MTIELKFWFEWSGGCVWPGDDACRITFELGPYDLLEPCPPPLSPEVLGRCRALAEWHDASLNWDSPAHPGPWRQDECDRFNNAAADLLADIRRELGPAFSVTDCRVLCAEDPELDSYRAGPHGFRSR